MGTVLRELVHLLHPHYIINVLLGVIFFVLKTTPPVCSFFFDDCELELREWELLTFLGCIIVMKNRKQSSYKVYLSTVCMFAKILNSILFFRQNPLMCVMYILTCLMHLAFLPEPVYSGPDQVVYFRGQNMEEEIERDKRVTWLIEFYAAWSPKCVGFAPIFAQLSAKYTLDNLKFGKLDASRYSAVAEKFHVNASAWSKQLPTIILFRNGKEVERRPLMDKQGRVLGKYLLTEESIIKDFSLNELYNFCRKNPIKKRKKREDLNSQDDDDGHEKVE